MHQKSYILNFLTSILLFLITSCSGGDQCIDPDDFGNPTFTISARYDDKLVGSPPNQIAPWLDTGLKANGRPITIVVRNWDYNLNMNTPSEVSAWTSWFGTSSNTNTLVDSLARMNECIFVNNTMCPLNNDSAVILNAPCLFKRGVGLYALIAQSNTDPNDSLDSKISPAGIAFHVGEAHNGYNLYTTNKTGNLLSAGGIVFNYDVPSGVLPQNSTATALKDQFFSSSIYLKILDSDYTDNSGQYRIIFKSGVDINRDDPLELITDLVKSTLFGKSITNKNVINNNSPASGVIVGSSGNYNILTYSGVQAGIIPTIFKNFTDNQSSYKIIVRLLLILYVIFTAINFLLGSIQLTNAEVLNRVIKIAIVSVLLTTNQSWNFFYNYLFVYFTDGLDYVLQIISNAVSGGGWGKLPLLQIMIAPQTFNKLFALLFSSYFGWIFVIIYMFLLFFVLIISVKATIIYLNALIVIGLLIALGPIFITFILFNITQSLFDNWLKQLISYTLQPIILFAGMGLLTLLIMQEIYATLGFRVCRQPIFNFGPINGIISGFEEYFGNGSNATSLFYFWFPMPRNFGADTTLSPIPVPYDHYDANGDYCQAYECVENRIPALPYLDPKSPRDQLRIQYFKTGQVIDFQNLFIFIIAIYLLYKFNETSSSIAKFLSNTANNSTDIGKSAAGAFKPIKDFTKDNINTRLIRPAIHAISNSPIGVPIRLVKAISNRATVKLMESIYSKELSSSSAMSKKVKELAEKKSGISYDSLNMKDYNKYKTSVQELFKEAGVKGFSATQLASFNSANLKTELALGKYGKSIEQLSAKEQQEFNKLLSKAEQKLGKSLDKAKTDLRDVDKFHKAYIDSHIELSNNGVGYFRKYSTTIDRLYNLKEKFNKFTGPSKEEILEKRLAKTEKFYKAYDEMLNKISGGALGGEFKYFDYQDSRLRTYGEKIVDQQLADNARKIDKKINITSIKEGHDILRADHQAKLELAGQHTKAEYFRQLADEDIQSKVYSAMSTSNADGKTILMGRRHMRERMSESDLRDAIDQSYNLKTTLLNEDRYLKERAHFTEQHDKSSTTLINNLDKLNDVVLAKEFARALDQKTFSELEMNSLLQNTDKSLKADIMKSVMDYQLQTATLQKLHNRHIRISTEVQTYIVEMNKNIIKAGYSEYRATAEQNDSGINIGNLTAKL